MINSMINSILELKVSTKMFVRSDIMQLQHVLSGLLKVSDSERKTTFRMMDAHRYK